MSKRFFALAFALGLAAVAWVGAGFAGSNWLALAMTAVIAGVYLLGANELRLFRAATAGLQSAVDQLATAPATATEWLERVPAGLRNTVRLRLEGERAALPGPALTPYLVGLLVMLGMLGTFLGMVVTFQGVVLALERSTEVQAIRAALAEPIRGLGLSFGTSVAGVAASAMLGLMSAIARRERLEVARQLEARIATVLRPFSLAHQRQQAFDALQSQARALPQVVDTLQAAMERMERRSEQLDAQLLQRQLDFQREVTLSYQQLAGEVGASLRTSLVASAAAAGDTIRPVVEDAMARIVRETQALQARMGEVSQAQVETLSGQFSAATESLARRSDALVAGIDGQVGRLLQSSQALVHARTESEAHWIAQHGQRMDELATLWRKELAALRQEESERGDAAVQRLAGLEAAVSQHLASLGAALEAPLSRLLQTASEVPQAAAGVIAQLRTEMSRLTERDNVALHERTQLLQQLGSVIEDLQQASAGQRTAIESMVSSASSVLQDAGARFAQAVDAQAGAAAQSASQIAAGASGLANVGEAFAQAVREFQASNEKLTQTLQTVESTLQRSTARSDEQLAYYVAQAREVIDLSIASQQGLVENLRQLSTPKPIALAAAGSR
ncbi:MAG TPA: hypothetical protein VHL79_04125 [Ramlibacter sp.]|jgi:hypothetical protein|nr:hypothetical protein [Ramlibacter sp.]